MIVIKDRNHMLHLLKQQSLSPKTLESVMDPQQTNQG
jgi:hypothetical protein